MNSLSSRLFFLLFLGFFSLPGFSQSFISSPEAQQKIHEFDYWLGEWDVYKTGTDTIGGYSRIESIIDSAGIQEHYRNASSPYSGTSINKYNFSKKKWEQFWVDNAGQTLFLEGNLVDGKMVLENEGKTPSGDKIYNRITWHNNDDGTVRQVWEQSQDGENWKAVFDGTYRRKK